MVETILVFAVIPLAIYGALALATLRKRSAAVARYRPGQAWEHPPIWWSGHPEGIGAGAPRPDAGDQVSTNRGGARGSW